jgi:hypothetical protein
MASGPEERAKWTASLIRFAKRESQSKSMRVVRTKDQGWSTGQLQIIYRGLGLQSGLTACDHPGKARGHSQE